MKSLTEKEQEKIQYGLLLLKSQDRLSKKFVKLIRDVVGTFSVYSLSLMKEILWCYLMVFRKRLRKLRKMK